MYPKFQTFFLYLQSTYIMYLLVLHQVANLLLLQLRYVPKVLAMVFVTQRTHHFLQSLFLKIIRFVSLEFFFTFNYKRQPKTQVLCACFFASSAVHSTITTYIFSTLKDEGKIYIYGRFSQRKWRKKLRKPTLLVRISVTV